MYGTTCILIVTYIIIWIKRWYKCWYKLCEWVTHVKYNCIPVLDISYQTIYFRFIWKKTESCKFTTTKNTKCRSTLFMFSPTHLFVKFLSIHFWEEEIIGWLFCHIINYSSVFIVKFEIKRSLFYTSYLNRNSKCKQPYEICFQYVN